MKTFIGILLVLAAVSAAVWAGGDEPNAATSQKDKRGSAGANRSEEPSPRRHGRGGRRGHRRAKALTEEQEKEFLAVLKENRPFVYRTLQRLKKHNEDRYRGVLYRHWLDWQQLQRMPKEVQQAHTTIEQGRRAMVKLMVQYRRADNDQARKKLTSQIRSLAADIYDAHLKMREYKITELETRIKQLRAELKDRRENRDQQIEKNVRRLLHRHGRRKEDGGKGDGRKKPDEK
jgi:hypothetical protein